MEYEKKYYHKRGVLAIDAAANSRIPERLDLRRPAEVRPPRRTDPFHVQGPEDQVVERIGLVRDQDGRGSFGSGCTRMLIPPAIGTRLPAIPSKTIQPTISISPRAGVPAPESVA